MNCPPISAETCPVKILTHQVNKPTVEIVDFSKVLLPSNLMRALWQCQYGRHQLKKFKANAEDIGNASGHDYSTSCSECQISTRENSITGNRSSHAALCEAAKGDDVQQFMTSPSKKNIHSSPNNRYDCQYDDGISSLHNSVALIHVPESPSTRVRNNFINNHASGGFDNNNEGESANYLRMLRRRNISIIASLIIFLGIVGAIAASIIFALKNKPIGGNGDTSKAVVESEIPTNITMDKENTTTNLTMESNITWEEVPAFFENKTNLPSSAPSFMGPCLPMEIGIIFDEYAIETGWKLVMERRNSSTAESDNEVAQEGEIVWQSKFYTGESYNSKAGIFRKCFPYGTYTFFFTDTEGDGICCQHGEGLYILSSEGKIVTVGGEMNAKEENVTFDLPYEEPEAEDKNKDGLDDRLGLLMPYNSSGLIIGVNCESFTLAIETDDSGLESTWELYEENDDAEKLVANGGPYGSNSFYEYDFCLATPRVYIFYIYDWGSDGLCCVSGKGSYVLSSGNAIIAKSSASFGNVEVTKFTLPINPYPSKTPTNAPTTTPNPSKTPSIAPSTPLPSSSYFPTQSMAPSLSPSKPPDTVDSLSSTNDVKDSSYPPTK